VAVTVALNYSKLTPGKKILDQSYVLDNETIQKYIDAVGGNIPPSDETEALSLVPPMAIASLWLRGVIKELEIPGGTLHVGQELEFTQAARIGDRIECTATILQNTVRKDIRFMVVQLKVTNDVCQPIMQGKGTLTLPE